MSEKIKRKHIATVKCPECGQSIDVMEKETITQPSQKKVSEKIIYAVKSPQTTL